MPVAIPLEMCYSWEVLHDARPSMSVRLHIRPSVRLCVRVSFQRTLGGRFNSLIGTMKQLYVIMNVVLEDCIYAVVQYN